MRRSGKTTRLVDYMVQHLFDKGEVVIPLRGWNGNKPNNFFDLNSFDQDSLDKIGHVQRNLSKVLKKRLDIEHPGFFECKSGSSEITFTLKSES